MKLLAFNNGYCEANQYFISKKRGFGKIKFPATFFYLEVKGVRLLIDTGYSPEMLTGFSLKAKIYAKAMGMKCDRSASQVLSGYGIDPNQVDYVIISHFHPDHYGGLCEFPNSRIICSRRAYQEVKSGRTLIFKPFIPVDFFDRVLLLEDFNMLNISGLNVRFYDILGLSELFGVHLEGHANGQMGILLPSINKFFIGDAVWCRENYEEKIMPRKMAQMIVFDNLQVYGRSIDRINKICRKFPDLDVLFTHDERFLSDEKYTF